MLRQSDQHDVTKVSWRNMGRPLFLVFHGEDNDQLLDSAEKLRPSHVEQGAEPRMTPVNPTG